MIPSFDFFKFVPSVVFPISWKACILTSSCSWYVFFSRTIRFSCDGLFDYHGLRIGDCSSLLVGCIVLISGQDHLLGLVNRVQGSFSS
jgi:hypothetical protein